MKEIHLDVETRSSVDLGKSGVYRYASSPDFEILLLGYSIDGSGVRVIDLASGETIPDEVLRAFTDDSIIKWAHNSTFERVTLSYWLRRHRPDLFSGDYLDPSSWRCTMVLAAYNGLPLSLDKVGAVLGFEEQKMKEGKELIRYFCTPSRTAGRDWNLPEHAPDKWKLFKKYNQRDVEVEMQIFNRLRNYPVPEFVWDEYHLSEEINDRGIMIDRKLVEQAVRIDEITKKDLTEKLKAMTGLENPNSVMQLKSWLAKQGIETESLGKKDVQELIESSPPKIAEVLSLRLMLAKSSVKKYQAMLNAVCDDDRCRGMFFFYGANRTGRFSGRIIQLQNLYRNSMPDLEQARELVKAGDYEMLSLLYGNVPEVLAQLVRTAFIPAPGHKFIVADFSAIEARVLSFLAKERWRIEVFESGCDIYCMSASQMFGVPVEKHGVNGHLRQKGKIAELACLSFGSPVLTDHGLVPIQNVTTDMKVWDGEEWVSHEGVVYRGEREVITYDGLTATPDHLVFVEGQTDPVRFELASSRGYKLIQTGDGERAIRLSEDYIGRANIQTDTLEDLRVNAMPDMRLHFMERTGGIEKTPQNEMRSLSAQENPKMVRTEVDSSKAAMRESEESGIQELWCEGNKIRLFQCNGSGALSDPGVWLTGQEDGNRPDRHKQRLCTGEPSTCRPSDKLYKSEKECPEQIRSTVLAVCQERSNQEIVTGPNPGRDHNGGGNCCVRKEEELADHQRTARLYDIRNAGRHHRFTVSGKLVHNCGYGGSIGALKAMGALEMGLTESELPSLVDAWRNANPHIVQYWWRIDYAVKRAVSQHKHSKAGCVGVFWKSGMLFITLPSGRRLAYVKPQIGENRFGGESVTYMGIDSTKHWSRIESYGPKFVENIVQAVSRDILAYAMKTLRYCQIVGHVHDELIIECSPDVSLDAVCEKMGRTPSWLPGIELRADGYECDFYKKE